MLLIEKMPDPGGISITSGGNVRIVEDAEEGFRHLQATNAATTPDPVLRALAAGMADIPAYIEKLARLSGATINRRQADGNYPFPGTKTFGYSASITCPDLTPSGPILSFPAMCRSIARQVCAFSRCSRTISLPAGCELRSQPLPLV